MLFAAEALVAEQGAAPAYVLAAEGWHPGVIGIVASRIAERHHRPTVLIALDGEAGTGSGRSIPAFDLLGGLTPRAGTWSATAAIAPRPASRSRASDVDAFRETFAAHAAAVLTPEDLVPECRVDAVVAGDALTLALAEELERLAPFGPATPRSSLLVPAAALTDPRPMGEGRHVAFTLHAGRRALALRAVRRRQPAAGRARRAGRRRGPARGEPLERRRRAAARPPPCPPVPPRADRDRRRAGLPRRARSRAHP